MTTCAFCSRSPARVKVARKNENDRRKGTGAHPDAELTVQMCDVCATMEGYCEVAHHRLAATGGKA